MVDKRERESIGLRKHSDQGRGYNGNDYKCDVRSEVKPWRGIDLFVSISRD